MRFFDAKRKKNNKFGRNEKKQYLPWVIASECYINGYKDACNKSIDYMAVVFPLFPNGIQHKESYKGNRKSIDKNKPPVETVDPAEDIDKKSQSPDSEKHKHGYNFAVEASFFFFKTFRRFPCIV